MHLDLSAWFVAVILALFLAIPAGAAESRADRHPADPAVPVPGIEYRSAFSDYQSLLEADRKQWRTANEEVQGGGHAGHGMQGVPAQRTGPETEKPQAPPTRRETGAGHAGH